jgi:hypothetical protein
MANALNIYASVVRRNNDKPHIGVVQGQAGARKRNSDPAGGKRRKCADRAT